MNATDVTVVEQPIGERVLVWAGFPIVGAGLGWVLQALAGWLLGLPWVPFEGPLRLIEQIPQPYATIGAVAVGALGGVVIAFLAERDYVSVTIEDSRVTVKQGEATRVVGKGSVSAVFVDQKQLVVLGRSTQELIRQRGDLPSKNRLAAAFRAHGYPWQDADPFDGDYRPWMLDSPDLTAEMHALLKARARALEKDDNDEAAELRDELTKLGVVVRDRDKRQSYRRTQNSV